ncbi:mucin-2-like [Physella acuta]|uniref:mucin-2-like n=1 Tax=Physella acuta TaxID=109671 RepID=UPI0027DB9CE1|nr:mucin-2-like [Physella acuta]
MASETITELLKANEEDFDKSIKEMSMKNLMETISSLQKEMAKEQETFNSLSAELQNRKERNSRQSKQISKDLTTSQQRLTLLMNRSMKCFSQIGDIKETQTANHNGEASPLKRRNSAKGPHPNITTSKTNIQRSHSLHCVNQPDENSSPSPKKTSQAQASGQLLQDIHQLPAPVIMKPSGDYKKWTNQNTANIKALALSEKKEIIRPEPESNVNLRLSGADETNNLIDAEASVANDNPARSDGQTGISSSHTGLYVKRKPAQVQRVTTTVTLSSSSFSPVHELSNPTPASTPVVTPSPALTPQHANTNDTHLLKTKPPTHANNPLQTTSANQGVSKPQVTADPEPQPRQYRGLPSVKLLAKSFGSTNALNVSSSLASGSRFGGSQSNLYDGKGVVRSYSSVSITSPSKPHSSGLILLSKGQPVTTSAEKTETPVVNGMAQQQPVIRKVQSTPQNSGPSELELARLRLKTNRPAREVTTNAEISSSQDNSQVMVPGSAGQGDTNGKQLNVGTYMKKKDSSAVRPASAVTTVASTAYLNSTSVSRVGGGSNPQIDSKANLRPTSTPPTQNSTSSTKPSYLKSSNSQNKPTSDLPHQLTKGHNLTPNTAVGVGNATNNSLPSKTPGTSARVVSTATFNMRRSKSKEELQESPQVFSKELLLRQIEARRRDDYDNTESNFRAMSKLSQSMPSLVNEEIGDGSRSFPIKSSIVLPEKTQHPAYGGSDVEDDEQLSKMNLRDWDPVSSRYTSSPPYSFFLCLFLSLLLSSNIILSFTSFL